MLYDTAQEDERWKEPTAAVARDAVDGVIGTSLIHAFPTPSAGTVMPSMPWCTNTIADLPVLLPGAYSDDVTDGFVARDQRPAMLTMVTS